MNPVNKARQSAVTVTGRDEGSRLRNGELFQSDLSSRRRGHLREMSYPQMAITWSEFEVGGATMPAGSARRLPRAASRHAFRQNQIENMPIGEPRLRAVPPNIRRRCLLSR
jgi:hypothetical protein